LAIAIQNLVFGLPIAGLISDQIGARRVAFPGGLIYAAGLYLLGVAESSGMLFASLGLLLGVALSCTSYVVILGAVAQVAPPNRRTSVFGLITAAGSFGMFLVVPFVQALIIRQGWREAVATLVVVAMGIALLALPLPGRRDKQGTAREAAGNKNAMADVLRSARGNRNYWLLNIGFFVCWFHVGDYALSLAARDARLQPALWRGHRLPVAGRRCH
jgi:MFS family permease